MLIDHCVTCHRQGGIGPWQMSGYDMVRGFAPMIREVVRTQRMRHGMPIPTTTFLRTIAHCRKAKSKRWCIGLKPEHLAAAAIRSLN